MVKIKLQKEMSSSNNFSVVLLILYLSFVGCESQIDVNNSTVLFNVGVILDRTTFVGNIGLTFLEMAHSDFYSAHGSYRTRLVLHVRDSNDQIIDAAAAGIISFQLSCFSHAVDLLKNVKTDAIIGPQKSSQANIVMDLGDRAHVPIISFSATSPSLLRRSPYFIPTAQSDDTQVGAIVAIVKSFHWRGVVIIHEDTEYGNGVIPYLSNTLQEFDIHIMYRSAIPLSATDDFILKELYKMMTQQTRVFVVHISSTIGARLFLKAKEIGMMNKGYAWIVSSDMMDLLYSLDSHVIEAMQGVIGVKPVFPLSEKQSNVSMFGLWAYDTLWALAMSAERIGTPKQPEISNSGNTTSLLTLPVSQKGPELLKAMLETSFQGLGGNFKLDKGQLQPSAYKILNVMGNKEKEVGMWVPDSKDTIDVSFHDILWPGKSNVVPKGWEFPVSGKRLKIAVPFKYGFTEFVNVVVDPITNQKKVSGYSIDIFDSVMSALPYAVPYDYYPYESMNGINAGSSYYDDLMQQVYLQNFDGAVGDISITANRSKYVDFTFPYAEGGISMIVPITFKDMNNKWVFLKPLTKELWLTSIAFAIGTGFVVWLLEHRINTAFRGGPSSQHVGMILYFPFTSLVFANSERIVSNLARMVVAVWFFVVLIWSSSYTASLSSRLTLQNLKPLVSDVEELKRNGDYVGYEYGSFIANVLKDMNFSESKLKDYRSRGESHDALSMGSGNGGISAFFDVVPYNKYFASKYCDKFVIIGPLYHTDGFGFVFQKGSPLVADVSRSLISFVEGNQLLDLQKKWFGSATCVGKTDGTPSLSDNLTLNSFKGLFIITGTVTGLCLVVYLGNYIYHNRMFLVDRISDSGTALRLKIRALCEHFNWRDLKSYPFHTDRVGSSLIEITSDVDNRSSHVTYRSRSPPRSDVIVSLSQEDVEVVDPNAQDMVVLDLST